MALLENIHSILHRHVPDAAIAYCENLWHRYRFDFRLRKSRVSKVGDFTFRRNLPTRITINGDLDPYLFLITYVHEVAHHEVHLVFGNRVESHGVEWKKAFQDLMTPITNEAVFPPDVLPALKAYMADPLASNFSDPVLTKALRKYDPRAGSQVFLSDVPEGSVFGIRGKWFRKGKTKRTRALCQELNSRRKYFVPVDAAVENVQLNFSF